MLSVASNPLELRGIANKTTKSGKTYYVVNTESDDGTPYALYCPDASAFAEGLKKGDKVRVLFEVNRFQGNEKLIVRKVEQFPAKV